MAHFPCLPTLGRPRAGSFLSAAAGLVGAATLLAACSGGSTNSGSGSLYGNGGSTSSTAASDASVYTIDTKSLSGAGTVLVDGKGRTLYVLTNESGGKLVCLDSNGCTTIWHPAEVPSGVSSPLAGNGVDTTKLTTERTSNGHTYSAYTGYALYTYTGDNGPGSTNGIGLQSFGGTWNAMSPSGSLVTSG